MNVSQSNLYEILDAFAIKVKVGEGVFEIKDRLEIDNGVIHAKLKIEPLHIHESTNSMYMLMRIGDLGIVAKARKSAIASVCLFDISHPVPEFYVAGGDWTALLTHMSKDDWKNAWIAEYITLC